jgi:hypothetical protein
MGRLGTLVSRLVALTVVWLLATTALTYAAAQRLNTSTPAPAAHVAVPPTASVVVVPDVRNQAYVFAEGTLGDSGFAWKVDGSVHGYASNMVVSQSPAPGTRVIDTGAPTITLRLAKGKTESGVPQDESPTAGTALKLADVVAPAVKKVVKKAHAVTRATATAKAKAPARKPPAQRKPDFVVAGARREPLGEIPLTTRADLLLRWIDRHPKATDANVKHWLYQHAWIVAGARMGWWHGSEALRTLVAVDRKVWAAWGIGSRSGEIARRALTYTEKHAK